MRRLWFAASIAVSLSAFTFSLPASVVAADSQRPVARDPSTVPASTLLTPHTRMLDPSEDSSPTKPDTSTNAKTQVQLLPGKTTWELLGHPKSTKQFDFHPPGTPGAHSPDGVSHGKGNSESGRAKVPQETGSDPPWDFDTVIRTLKRESSLIDLKSIGETMMSLRRRVTDNPSDEQLRVKLGSYLLLAGDYEGAATEFKRAVALKPQDYKAHALLARTLDDVAANESAAQEYRHAIELAPNAPEPHLLYADSLLNTGEMSAAINEYRRAINARPTADALTGLAEALIVARDKIGSLKAARQAVSLDPSSARAHVALTKSLILSGDFVSSMRTARQAVLLSPSMADSHIALGRVLHAKGDLNGAVEEFRQAADLDPLNAWAHNDLGYALYSKGDLFAAITELRIALRLNPHLGEARNNLEIAIHGLSGRK